MNCPKIKLFFWRFFQYLRYCYKAKSKWRIHSPWVYTLVTKVFTNQPISLGKSIEKIRKEYFRSKELVSIQDYGAGYDNQKQIFIQKKLFEVTKSSARNRKEGELLYRIIKYHKPQIFLELGTNLGFSTAYISYALHEIYQNDFQFVSVEGSYNLHLYAHKLLKMLNLQVTLVHDTFDNFLKTNVNKKWDGVFIDGNHTFDATIRYFNILKHQVTKGGIMILDDIYWSPEMQKAWKHIIQDPKVTLSIDIFRLGIVYIEKNQAKEHFRVWY